MDEVGVRLPVGPKYMRKNNLILEKMPTLGNYQKYIRKITIERGFQNETVPEIVMLFLEECGEMAKAVRKSIKNIKSDVNSEKFQLENEVSDVFTYLLIICNHFNIDLGNAFRDKEVINKKRKWN